MPKLTEKLVEENLDHGRHLKIEHLKEGLLVMNGRQVFQVSTVYSNYATMQLVFPVPERTTVQEFRREAIDLYFTHIGPATMKKLEKIWDEQLEARPKPRHEKEPGDAT